MGKKMAKEKNTIKKKEFYSMVNIEMVKNGKEMKKNITMMKCIIMLIISMV